MCYNKNMKRIGVLKNIEQILVQKAYEAVHDGLKDAVLDRWSSIYVQKSAVRDMQSAPTTKNMGF